ncbi:HPr family phosphocarrier protein [Lawsonella clevelandensis]|uniref:Phosphocarrier protein HPr n=1 Tax=Lawsonella clevelandensis TaxID=1528099 RepID=A0A0M3TBE6_9ACTN|nr:HPr family phosphocarrier protein [Lawsonella clevelandensis]ALE18504.1 serine kinase [Lawsonella clevelandensis]ALE34160.1 serine kinase [Lawsonella clevelandensis]MDU7193926.1 HPr family phosphocarrier protein [Lawsonella clevelandensis]VHN99728.1 Phosphocarrier protein HPr [Lawsonella clevelandensis]
MTAKDVVVGSAIGLHARPAGIISDAAAKFDEEITIAVDGEEPVNATSALLIMSLGVEHGQTVTIESENVAAVDAIADLVAQDLDAE